MSERYFVMLVSWTGDPTPLVDTNEEVVLFDTEDAASEAAILTPVGASYGWEVFPWG